MSVSAIQDAFEDALRRAEAHHKVHVGTYGDTDWVPFYAAYLAIEFAGVRIPLNVDAETLPHETVPDGTGDSTPFQPSNRKWEPTVQEGPCGYGCGE